MASKLKTAEPITAPDPISSFVNKTLTPETNISGPDIPNGIRIELVIPDGNCSAEKTKIIKLKYQNENYLYLLLVVQSTEQNIHHKPMQWLNNSK